MYLNVYVCIFVHAYVDLQIALHAFRDFSGRLCLIHDFRSKFSFASAPFVQGDDRNGSTVFAKDLRSPKEQFLPNSSRFLHLTFSNSISAKEKGFETFRDVFEAL